MKSPPSAADASKPGKRVMRSPAWKVTEAAGDRGVEALRVAAALMLASVVKGVVRAVSVGQPRRVSTRSGWTIWRTLP